MDLKRATMWALFGLSVTLSSSEARAQEQVWLRDEQLSGGDGVGRERLRYTGGVAAVFGYDSNPFLRSGDADEPRADAFRLSITPFFRVQTRNPPGASKAPYDLNASASLSYFEFIQGPTKSSLPDDDLSGHRNFGFAGSLRLRIAPDARWGGELRAGVARTIQPSNLGDPTASFNRTNPSFGGSLVWTPGGGLFSWRVLGYDLIYNYFEAERFQRYNNFNHRISSVANWRFLPRTTLFTDSRLDLIRYSNASEQNDGDTMTSRAGINGLLTNRFGFLAALGWATTVFDSKANAPRQDFDSLLAQAEARFFLSVPPPSNEEGMKVHPTTIVLGYQRDWSQSYIGNFYSRDRGYTAFYYFFSTRVRSTLQLSASYLGFPSTAFENGAPRDTKFNSIALNGTFFAEYLPTPHLGIFANGDYASQITDKRLRVNRNDPNIVDNLSFNRVFLGLGLRYLL
jgi:hypothetical protein